jgi:hypothetical protein
MQLARHGLRLITPEVGVTALSPDGRALVLYNDTGRAAAEVGKFSSKDAAKYPEFQAALQKISRVIGEALKLSPQEQLVAAFGFWTLNPPFCKECAVRTLDHGRGVVPRALAGCSKKRSGTDRLRCLTAPTSTALFHHWSGLRSS